MKQIEISFFSLDSVTVKSKLVQITLAHGIGRSHRMDYVERWLHTIFI